MPVMFRDDGLFIKLYSKHHMPVMFRDDGLLLNCTLSIICQLCFVMTVYFLA